MLSLEEAHKHPHNLERGSFEGGVPKPAPVLSRTPGKSKGMEKLPQVGEHTRAVLASVGYSEGDINKLVENGVIDVCKSKL